MWDLETMRRMNDGACKTEDARRKDDDRTSETYREAYRDTPQVPAARYGHPDFYRMLEEIGELHNKKNFDYADGGEQGPLGNFRRIASIASLYPESQAWNTPTGVAVTYMLKQLDAALMLLTTGKTSKTGEGLGERFRDVAVYALLAIILDQEEGN
jgi:hypothetical protein